MDEVESTTDSERLRLAKSAARYALRRHTANFWYEELFQEAWVAAYEAYDTWDGSKSSLASWMIQRAFYTAMDAARVYEHTRHHGRRCFPVDLEDIELVSPRLVWMDEAGFAQVESRVLVQQLMACLTPKQKDLLTKVDFEGMTLAEYAEREGVTEAAISIRRKKAIEKIRAWFGIDVRLPIESLSRVYA